VRFTLTSKLPHRVNCILTRLRFRIPVQVSILSERRVYHPYGLAGGEDASCGLNIWVRKVKISNTEESNKQLNGQKLEEDTSAYEERRINLGGKNTAAMKAGERIIVCTPGGGGWGKVGDRKDVNKEKSQNPKHAWRGGSHASREEMALQA
jgi:5-oxoprolinase (ATP-hydrolysing)